MELTVTNRSRAYPIRFREREEIDRRSMNTAGTVTRTNKDEFQYVVLKVYAKHYLSDIPR